MRATEFIAEDKVGKISKRNQNATVGLNKFRDKQFADRVYELNRIMMAVASTDGTFVPKLDGESWSGRNNVAAPYTKEEQAMLKKAYQAIGSHHEDLNHGDLNSQEHPAVNTTSVVNAFKGYPR
jgi:hypothetical protein